MGFTDTLGLWATLLALAAPAPALANSPVCEVDGRNFYLKLATGSRLEITGSELLKLAVRNECVAPVKPYACNISLTRVNLRDRYGNHCRPIENSPESFDYYSLTMSSVDAEVFATGTCYKVECQYLGDRGDRRMVYDNSAYCTEKPSDLALEKLVILKQLGFCKR
jgi:hypothetical protein